MIILALLFIFSAGFVCGIGCMAWLVNQFEPFDKEKYKIMKYGFKIKDITFNEN